MLLQYRKSDVHANKAISTVTTKFTSPKLTPSQRSWL